MTSRPNTEPIFGYQPIRWRVALTTQTYPRDGGDASPPTGAIRELKLLGIAGEAGAIIESIEITATGTVGVNVLLLFTLQQDEANYVKLSNEATLPSATGSLTQAIAGYPVNVILPNILFEYSGAKALLLAPNEALYCSLGSAEITSQFIVVAQGKDYAFSC